MSKPCIDKKKKLKGILAMKEAKLKRVNEARFQL